MARRPAWDEVSLIRAASPSHVPHETFLYMGADPCHSPDKEDQRRDSCDQCGGERKLPNGRLAANRGDRDPIRPYETLAVACVCGRSAYHESKLPGRVDRSAHDAGAADKSDAGHRTEAALAQAPPKRLDLSLFGVNVNTGV